MSRYRSSCQPYFHVPVRCCHAPGVCSFSIWLGHPLDRERRLVCLCSSLERAFSHKSPIISGALQKSTPWDREDTGRLWFYALGAFQYNYYYYYYCIMRPLCNNVFINSKVYQVGYFRSASIVGQSHSNCEY